MTSRKARMLAILAAMAVGCERPSEGEGGHAGSAPPVARVEVVRPERQTVRRTVGEPGQLQAFETAEVHARIPGYVKGWTANIGDSVKKGQLLAELSDPELEADLRQKEAAIEQAVAKRKQAEAAVEVAQADIAGSEAKLAEVRAGSEPGRRRRRPLAGRASTRRATVRGAGADRHAARRDPEQVPLGRGDARGGPGPGEIGRGRRGPGQGRAGPRPVRRRRRGRRHRRRHGRRGPCPGDARLHPDRGPVRRRRHPAERRHRRPDPARRRPAAAVRRRPLGHRHHRGRRPRGLRHRGQSGRPGHGEAPGDERPGRRGEGLADLLALDPKTRTIRVEIDLPNPERAAPPRPLRLRDHRRRGAPRRADRPDPRRSSRRAARCAASSWPTARPRAVRSSSA